MNRILIAAGFVALALTAPTAEAQSWIFQPGTYAKTYGPQAPNTATKPQSHGTFSESQAIQAPEPEAKPRVYATFTESQAAQAARLPKPAFQWDPSGVLGRGQMYDLWGHQEAMERARLQTYAQGVRDAVGAPIWTWSPLTPRPIPQIFAPTATSPGKSHPRP